MSFSELCRAVYVRREPYGSQAKFVRALFEAAGSRYGPDDAYCKKLFTGDKLLSRDILDSFPQPFLTCQVAEFLRDYLVRTSNPQAGLETRCVDVAAKAGLPTNLDIDPTAFIPALADWFQAIIKNPENSNILPIAYQRRLEGDDAPDLASFTPLYAGDEVIVTNPPSQQSHCVLFWDRLTHRWALQNTGTVAWSGRSLLCINPKVNGLRPKITKIPVPDIGPQGFVSVECHFVAHSFEGWSTSRWQMVDAEGNNCFPNHSSILDVKARIANPDSPRSEERQ